MERERVAAIGFFRGLPEHELGALARAARPLESIKAGLDQCGDLLRQRRALREAGGDHETAKVREPEVVEHYEQ